MKRIVSVLLALSLLLVFAFAQAEAASDKDFVLTFTGNPTTGYGWTYVADEEYVTVTEEYLTAADIDKIAGIEPAAETEMISGEGGLYVYTIKGVQPGETIIAFEYGQSWDETSTVVGLTYAIRVNEDLSVVAVAGTAGV